MRTTWQANERRAAAALGLATAGEKSEPEKVRTLDVELSDGGRVVLTVTKCGALFIQSFKDSSHGIPLWALSGTCTVDAEFVREWAESLHEAVGVKKEHAL